MELDEALDYTSAVESVSSSRRSAKKRKRREMEEEIARLRAQVEARQAHGGGEAAAAAAEPEMTTVTTAVPLDGTDWDKYEESEEVTDENRTFCLYSYYSQSAQEKTVNNSFVKLQNFDRENRRDMSPFQFVRTMQSIYNTTIRPYLKNDNGGAIVQGLYWPAPNIWNHQDRIMHPYNQDEQIGITFRAAMETLTNNGIFEEDVTTNLVTKQVTKKRKVNPSALKLYIHTAKEARPYMAKLQATRDMSLLSVAS